MNDLSQSTELRKAKSWQAASAFASFGYGAGVILFPLIAYWTFQTHSWVQFTFAIAMTAVSGALCRMFWKRFRRETRWLREQRTRLPDRVFRRLGEAPRDL